MSFNTKNSSFILAFLFFVLTTQSVMGEDNSPVTFPENFEKGVIYFKKDRGSITEDIYVDKSAIKALQDGGSLPSGTVITLVEYFAKDGKGDDGYSLKGELKRYVVMEKRKGWGQNAPASMRNGEWKYQAFNPDKTVQKEENLERCFSCHSSEASNDYVFTLDAMKNFNLK